MNIRVYKQEKIRVKKWGYYSGGLETGPLKKILRTKRQEIREPLFDARHF
jgi:hypothetical protein